MEIIYSNVPRSYTKCILKFGHINSKVEKHNLNLLFELCFHHFQSPCKSRGNICNTFSSFRPHEGAALVQGPNLRVL